MQERLGSLDFPEVKPGLAGLGAGVICRPIDLLSHSQQDLGNVKPSKNGDIQDQSKSYKTMS